MARVFFLVVLIALAAAAPPHNERPLALAHERRALLAAGEQQVAQQQCQACSTCRNPECWRTCKVYCPPTAKTPDNYVVKKGSQCLDAGATFGPRAAKAACQRLAEECKPQDDGGMKLGAAYGDDALGTLSLKQCTKVAMGACQQAAGDSADDDCQNAAANGFGTCDSERFKQRFHELTAEVCRQAAMSVTNVDPVSGNWAVRDDNGYRRLAARR